ncbi:MAG: hypothetical protein ACRD0P_07840 [Stackebrandtia sp.]
MNGAKARWDAATVRRHAAEIIANYQRAASKMYTLDSHGGLRFLQGDRLSGETADQAAFVKRVSQSLWPRFDEVRRLCDRVPSPTTCETLSGEELHEVGDLLRDDAVELDSHKLPTHISSQPMARTTSLGQLAIEVEYDCMVLLSMCDEADSACGAVADAAAAITTELRAAEAAAAEHGMTANSTLARLRERHVSELDAALCDPITARREDKLTELSRQVTAFGQWLSELDAVRREFPDRLSRLRDSVDALAAAEDRAAQSCAVAEHKIAAPAPPRLVPAAESLARRVRDLETLASQADWHNLADQLTTVTEALSEAETAARRATDNADALVDRRTELRGRFSAYTRKAARVGVIEEPRVAASAQRTRELLWLAPCDLPSATRALNQFQQDICGAQEETP